MTSMNTVPNQYHDLISFDSAFRERIGRELSQPFGILRQMRSVILLTSSKANLWYCYTGNAIAGTSYPNSLCIQRVTKRYLPSQHYLCSTTEKRAPQEHICL